MLNPFPIARRASSHAVVAPPSAASAVAGGRFTATSRFGRACRLRAGTAVISAAMAMGAASSASADVLHRYEFNSPTPIDSIGAAHAALVGPAVLSGGVLDTSGGGYVALPPGTGAGMTSGFTIELWVNWRGGSAPQTMFVAAGAAPPAIAIRTSATTGTTFDLPAAGLHAVTGQLATGRRSHIVLVCSTARPGFLCYLDGSLHVQVPISPILRVNLADLTGDGFALGGSAAATENSFNGVIEEVRLYNHALNDREVRTHWTLDPAACQAPAPQRQPGDHRTACVGGTAYWTLFLSDVNEIVFQWQRQTGVLPEQWEDLRNGPAPGVGEYAGTGTPRLLIYDAAPFAHEHFRCVMTGPCGGAISNVVEFATCLANFNCSGVADMTDLNEFLAAWFAGDERANIDGEPGVTVHDLLDFLTAWFTGCG